MTKALAALREAYEHAIKEWDGNLGGYPIIRGLFSAVKELLAESPTIEPSGEIGEALAELELSRSQFSPEGYSWRAITRAMNILRSLPKQGEHPELLLEEGTFYDRIKFADAREAVKKFFDDISIYRFPDGRQEFVKACFARTDCNEGWIAGLLCSGGAIYRVQPKPLVLEWTTIVGSSGFISGEGDSNPLTNNPKTKGKRFKITAVEIPSPREGSED